MKETTSTIKDAGGAVRRFNGETTPLLQANLLALQKTLEEMQGLIGKDSPLNYNAKKSLEELTMTLRALRELTNAIDRQPESHVFGKEENKDDNK